MRWIPSMCLCCLLLAGCQSPDVNYSDLTPDTTATLSNAVVTIHLGSDRIASACWTIPKAKVEGQTIYIVGYRTLRERSREFTVELPKALNGQLVKVVWVNPDGSQVPVRVEEMKAN